MPILEAFAFSFLLTRIDILTVIANLIVVSLVIEEIENIISGRISDIIQRFFS